MSDADRRDAGVAPARAQPALAEPSSGASARSEHRNDNPDVTVVVLDAGELRRDWRARVTRPAVGWALAAVGALLIIIGYWGVAHESLVAKQIPYLVSGGIGGMVLVAVGAFLLGTDDVRKQLERVERLEALVGDLHRALLTTGEPVGEGAAVASPNGAPNSGALVALPRARSYHRAGCAMVEGKSAAPIAPGEAESRGLAPCPLCSPAAAATSVR